MRHIDHLFTKIVALRSWYDRFEAIFKIGDLVIARFNGKKHYYVRGRIACFHDEFADIIVEKTNVQPTDIKRYVVCRINLRKIKERNKVRVIYT